MCCCECVVDVVDECVVDVVDECVVDVVDETAMETGDTRARAGRFLSNVSSSRHSAIPPTGMSYWDYNLTRSDTFLDQYSVHFGSPN